jgi:hypothetical protein
MKSYKKARPSILHPEKHWQMALTKEEILRSTRNGYDVFSHYIGISLVAPNKAFRNPFYHDTRASCYVYADKETGIFKIKDFGDPEYCGDCFYLVGKLKRLSCDDKHEFVAILQAINTDLNLNLDDNFSKTERIVKQSEGKVVRATSMPSVHDGFDTAKNSAPMTIRAFTPRELAFWAQYGITPDVLSRYHVVAVQQYRGTGKTGKAYELNASSEAPIFGYQGKRFTKLYLPNSETRFLYTGDVTENYVFGLEQLPLRGIFCSSPAEKRMFSVWHHMAFMPFVSTARRPISPKTCSASGYRFRHVVLLYDTDQTGLSAA